MSEIIDKLTIWGADMRGAMERFCEDTDFYEECFNDFIANSGIDELEAIVKSGEYTGAFEAAHKIKGIVGNLGLTPLYQVTCDIVEPLRAQDFSNIDAEFKAMKDSFNYMLMMIE